ncbi:MAG: Uma2 family endonuclease [Candidatus Rokubacteria bacterium]|nr:Uma2 family endonuclease [Candidatus Rokubacteria bacterium]
MKQTPFTPRRWTRAEYDLLVEQGVFEDEPLELLGGQLLVAEPKGPYHATGVGKVTDGIRAALPPGWVVRVQLSIALDDESEPEPDIAVVAGTHDDYLDDHPARPVLVVEVAHSSLRFDRSRKGSAYARAGLSDYWIVNLVDRLVEVYREPVPDPAARYGWRYGSMQTFGPGDVVVPLALPSASVAVSDLLPRSADKGGT